MVYFLGCVTVSKNFLGGLCPSASLTPVVDPPPWAWPSTPLQRPFSQASSYVPPCRLQSRTAAWWSSLCQKASPEHSDPEFNKTRKNTRQPGHLTRLPCDNLKQLEKPVKKLHTARYSGLKCSAATAGITSSTYRMFWQRSQQQVHKIASERNTSENEILVG